MAGEDLGEGWDSVATLVDGRWVERRPKRDEVRAWLLRETTVLPWLAPQLPLPVPIPVVWQENPLVVRRELVPGEPGELTADDGGALGRFLRALHSADVPKARELGAVPEDLALDAVPPLLGPLADRARALLAEVEDYPADTVVHGDVGPEHVLKQDGRVSGVIDWSDVSIGDPARDLAWLLFGTSAECVAAFSAEYEVTPELRRRAWAWNQLGPWYEVTYGLENDRPDLVESGLAGTRARLVETSQPCREEKDRQG
ncbi:MULTISPECIES: phosphotransferase [Amycolatopsis]|uniref:Phosphotransferase n=1 Tax=Amycolatopsis albidoflavus TaxID=102226 RepID=A0ABW5HRN3_9PSEU